MGFDRWVQMGFGVVSFIGYLSIGLQWWVLLLGFDLVVFFAEPISLVVFDVGFAFGFV